MKAEFGPPSRSRKKVSQVRFYGHRPPRWTKEGLLLFTGLSRRRSRADRGLPETPGASGRRSVYKESHRAKKFQPRHRCRYVASIKGSTVRRCGGNHKTRSHAIVVAAQAYKAQSLAALSGLVNMVSKPK